MSIMVTNIQRMCMQDGPGIRTTVFLKGCSLHCPWCSNPENILFDPQYYYKGEVCSSNRGTSLSCKTCPGKDILLVSGTDKAYCCPFGAIGVYGKEYEADELVRILLKDVAYWKDGGVTFSGGEALMQAEGIAEAMRLLKEKNVHIAVETALHVPVESVEIILEYVDFFYIDVKILDKTLCERVLGGQIDLYVRNVNRIIEANKDVVFRIPCCDEYTLADGNIKLLKAFFLKYSGYPVELFRLHTLGNGKYRSLGYESGMGYEARQSRLEDLREWLDSNGNQAKIIKL